MNHDSRRNLTTEIAVFLATVGFMIFCMKDALILGRTTYVHDNLYWGLPFFHIFADGIRHGQFGLWNPFSHGGETLIVAFLQLRLLDPVSILVVLAGSPFTGNLTTLFNWDTFARVAIGGAGVYFLLRNVAQSREVRLVLIPLVFLSTLITGGFHQNGLVDQFYLTPFLAYFFLRLLEDGDYRRRNWIGVGLFFGASIQSYFFVGSFLLLFGFLLGYLIFRRDRVLALLSGKGNIAGFLAATAVVAVMALPMFFFWIAHGSDLFFTARYMPPHWQSLPPRGGPFDDIASPDLDSKMTLLMPYQMIWATGSSLALDDFLGLWTSQRFFGPWYGRLASEAAPFFGALAFLVSLVGIGFGRHPSRRVWLLVLAFFALLGLGPKGGLHALLYYVLPPLWFMRHTHLLSNFIQLALLFFFVIGLDRLLEFFPRARSVGTQWLDSPAVAAIRAQRGRWIPWLVAGIVLAAIGALGLKFGGLSTIRSIVRAMQSGSDWFAVFLAVALAAVLALATLVPGFVGSPVTRSRALSAIAVVLATFAFGIGFRLAGQVEWTGAWQQPAVLVLYAAALAILGRKMPRLAFFVALTLAWLAFAVYAGAFRKLMVMYVTFFLLLPVAMLAICHFAGLGKRWALAVVFFFAFANAGVEFARWRDWLTPRPDPAFATREAHPAAPAARTSMLALPAKLPLYEQVVRYMEILARRPVALDPLRTYPRDGRSSLRNESFDEARREGTWNSFAFYRAYGRLIYSDLDSRILERAFAIRQSPIQFRAEAIRGSDFVGDMKRLDPAAAAGLLDRAVYIEDGTAAQDALPALPKEARKPEFRYRVIDYDYDNLKMDVRAGTAGFVYFADGYDPAWRAFVDGKETKVYRADGNFKAIAVPPGEHAVSFSYSPTAMRGSILLFQIVFVLGVIWLAVLGAIDPKARREPEPGRSDP